MADSHSSSASAKTPTLDELRWIVNKVHVSTTREGEVWRWLASSLAELVAEHASLLRFAEEQIGEITFRDGTPIHTTIPLTGDVRKLSIRQCRILGLSESYAGNCDRAARSLPETTDNG